MASNRDPRKDYRINRRGRKVTSSSDRSRRSAKASAPKPTSSSTRSRGSGTGSKKVTSAADRVKKNPVGPPRGAQGPRTAPSQGPSRKTPTKIGQRSPSVKAPPTKPRNVVKPTKGKSGSNLRGTATVVAAGALSSGALRNPVTRAKKKASDEKKAKASQSKDKYNTRDADGTVRSRLKVGPKKVGEGKVGTVAQAFDKAYASAKKDGKKSFTFKGKKYTTK